MSPVVLYGQFSDHWSVAGTSRGLACGLAANGVPLYLHDTQRDPEPTLSVEGLWQAENIYFGTPDHSVPDQVDIGVFVGYPPFGASWLSRHKTKVGCFITESALIPEEWAAIAKSCDLVVVPSAWVQHVYAAAGVTKHMLVPHGLPPAYSECRCDICTPAAPLRTGAGWRFLHLCGTRDFLDRKGTPQLIEAFGLTFSAPTAPTARLTIRTPPSQQIYDLVQRWGDLIEIEPALEPLSPGEMRAYLHQRWAALVQPSRAEAFGLCCIEARALGVPVIATHCSGHAEHAARCDVPITSGFNSPIAVNGIPMGMAPTVTVQAIRGALERFVRERVAIRADAQELRQGYYDRWSWQAVTAPLAAWLRERL